MSRSELLQLGRSQYGVNENSWVSVAMTGNVTAAAAALDSVFWVFTTPSDARGKNPMVIERLKLRYTCTTAFTTPVTVDRALAFCRLPSAPSLVGIANLGNIFRKQALLNVDGTDGSVAACSSTPFDASGDPPTLNDIFAVLPLAGFGTAGATVEAEWNWNTGSAAMLNILPGEVLGLITPFGMDAAGRFQLSVECDLQALPTDYPDAP